jgi:hypothetical protein
LKPPWSTLTFHRKHDPTKTCNSHAKRQFHSSKAMRQSGIADNGPSIVGQPIEESARLESGEVESGDKVPSWRSANLDIALTAQVARIYCAGRVDRRH